MVCRGYGKRAWDEGSFRRGDRPLTRLRFAKPPSPTRGEGRKAHDRLSCHRRPAGRDARSGLQMAALRRGQAICGIPQPAAELRSLRTKLCPHRLGRWPGGLHHHDCRRRRGRLRPDRRDQIPAAVLASCGALAAADPGDHAFAAALDEVAPDRAAVPSQGRRRPADRSRTEMIGTRMRRRGVAGFGALTLAMVALFVGLGVWQLQRRVEKHALIAALSERLAATPGPLPSPAEWGALTPARDEFRRVSFAATYESRPDAMVYSSGSGIREDISGPGTWAVMPRRLPGGETVVVNAGFVQNTMQDREQQDRAVVRLINKEPVTFTGYIRFPAAAARLTPQERTTK